MNTCPHTRINPHGGTDHCSPLCLDCGRLLPFEVSLMQSDWIAVYLPMRADGETDPTRAGFSSEDAAWEYVYAGMCRECREERARVLAGNAQEFDSDWPACAAEWMVLPTESYKHAASFDEMCEAAGWVQVPMSMNPPATSGDKPGSGPHRTSPQDRTSENRGTPLP